ncbi:MULTISPECIES: aspartate dehydrogenase [unclassified Methylobacterium]|uniref:aspartate dehydrogenase n=1 Tax=unclassified Methylobacterium TaxID=2615210 RepID=UPI0036FF9898
MSQVSLNQNVLPNDVGDHRSRLHPLRVGIAGAGAIGGAVAKRLLAEPLPGLSLTALSAHNPSRAAARVRSMISPDITAQHPLFIAATDLAQHADIVIEALPPSLFRSVAEPVLRAGRILIPLSVGALIAEENDDLVRLAMENASRIFVPSGAVGGIDLLRNLQEGGIESVSLITRKPAISLAGAPWLLDQGIDISRLSVSTKVFSGSARQAVQAFPTNANVAAAVALAGIGPEQTHVEIWADPLAESNRHRIVARGHSANVSIDIEAKPSVDNPRTSQLAGDSIIALLRRLASDQALLVGN